MKNLLTMSLLALLCLSVTSAVAPAADRMVYSIVANPGMTNFSFAGEDFTVVTTQRLEINFEGITASRVWGFIIPLDGYSIELVKFIWVSAGHDPLTLHEGILGGRRWCFDSDNVTGHNEKLE
jgi:hypothetical protein